ncbi:RagB/SusD family nutrient uptake outer membrane protein [Parapedobacter sp. 2B3]|uniref:RagB/SusD family nutrient uptake outer membrane protein n=1 Tax=Parapedobacter sp. 2B3 TaxID=3342381 RepID=UPI0035B59526
MKRILTIIIALPLTFIGCSEGFLDRHSLTQLAADNFWQNEKDALLAINGIYDVLQTRQLYSGNLNGDAGIPMYDSFTDNSFNLWKYEGPGNYVEGNVSASTTGMFENFWLANYRGIVRSNQAITNLPKMTEDQISTAAKDNFMGQSLFLRALFYLNLVTYYEDVPLITEPQTLETAQVAKTPKRQVLDQIIADLQQAADLLPTTQSADRYGHATKGAAYGLLARVYLLDQDWKKAAAAAQDVIALGQYDLSLPYDVQFTEDGENSKDVVFSVRFVETPGFSANETFSSTYVGQPKVDKQPLPNLVADFYCTDGKPITVSDLYNPSNPKENRDPRLLASVWFKGDIYITDVGNAFNGNNVTGYGLKKYIRTRTSDAGIGPAGNGGQDFYILRYADVLLMRAEALIEDNQIGDEVYSLINQVRQRPGVGMPTVQEAEGTGLSQPQLRDIIRHERRVEFAFEGLRFFDLIRWGIVSEAYERMVADNLNGYNPRYQNKRSETFPIPLSELDANKALIQHDAWK